MDHYVRGSARRFAWRDVLKTLEDEAEKAKKEEEAKKLAEGKEEPAKP
jgi:hypothetical protein